MRPVPRNAPYRAILRNRPFVALWIGQSISRFGDALYDLALLWHVLDRTGSAFAAAGIAVAAGGGRLLGSLVAGIFLDRVAARPLMLATESARCAATVALGAAWLVGCAPPLAVLYGLALTLALGGALFTPARLAAIPQFVARGELVTANALDQLAASLVSTVAWGLSGAIVAILGPARGLLVDAATFLVSLLAVALGGTSEVQRNTDGGHGPLDSLLAGARWLKHDRLGRTVLAAQLAQACAGAAFFAGIGPLIEHELGGGSALYGIQGAAYGAALMIGSWAIGRLAVRRIGRLYALGFMVNGLGNVGFALARVPVALLPPAFVAGLGAAAFITGEITLLQANVPAEVRGRVIALTVLLATAVGMVSLAGGGWLADHAQIRAVMCAASLAHVAIGGMLLLSAPIWSIATEQ